jgi:hypothetical protein
LIGLKKLLREDNEAAFISFHFDPSGLPAGHVVIYLRLNVDAVAATALMRPYLYANMAWCICLAAGVIFNAEVAAHLVAVIKHGYVKIYAAAMAQTYGGVGPFLAAQIQPVRVAGADHYAIKRKGTDIVVRGIGHESGYKNHGCNNGKPQESF